MTGLGLVPIPERMQSLPCDQRGYPIPFVVQRDHAGLPLFIVNDSLTQQYCIRNKLCSICGQKLGKELWFAGGPGSALHPYGMYFDSAMHHECVTYAMQVCPYLALPNYHARESEAKIDRLQKRLSSDEKLLVDPTQEPGRPRMFVVVMAYGQSLIDNIQGQNPHLKPLRPYHAIEFWRHGKRLPMAEGMEAVRRRADLDLSALRLIVK